MKRACAITAQTACWFFYATVAVAGTADPLTWLERMSTAMSQMTYQGTFVYIQGNQLETMRITHVSDVDGVRERLVSLSGSPGEVLRDSSGVRWVTGDGASVLADGAFNRPFSLELPPDHEDLAGESYTLKLGGKSLIAGHKARNIKVIPRDHFRYGYSLWLEEHSGLLLKWELLDTDREPIARLMYTDIRLGSEVDRSELQPGNAMKQYETVVTELPSGGTGKPTEPRWKPTRLPPGFSLTTHRYHGGDGSNNEYEHLVYSDGIAAVSVYVESMNNGSVHPELTQKHGTTHVHICASGGMMVTVVGNVPAVTAEMIGKSVEAAEH